MWQHNYEPIAGSLGVSALAAVLPIVVLFLMLGVLRKPAWMSALAALVSALLVSLIVYRMPAGLAFISTIYGAAFGIFEFQLISLARLNGQLIKTRRRLPIFDLERNRRAVLGHELGGLHRLVQLKGHV